VFSKPLRLSSAPSATFKRARSIAGGALGLLLSFWQKTTQSASIQHQYGKIWKSNPHWKLTLCIQTHFAGLKMEIPVFNWDVDERILRLVG